MMGSQPVKGSACPARAAQILKVFDLTLTCALCGYVIPPNELLHVGWHDIKCPACRGVFDSRARTCFCGLPHLPEEGP
jgi:phage FluMu protein Com